MHWQVDFASAGEVLNVAVAAVFWSAWDSPCPLSTDLLLDIVGGAASVDIDGLWWFGDDAIHGVG